MSRPNTSSPRNSHRHSDPGNECTASGGSMAVCDDISWKPASSSLEFPGVPFPSRRVFQSTGEIRIRALVRTHHELLRAWPLGRLFPAEPQRFAERVDRAADYFVEA
jgi:hypothetical protein